jgi:hypothetical protein
LGISCRLGRRRHFSSLFRRVIRQMINNAAGWRPIYASQRFLNAVEYRRTRYRTLVSHISHR